MGFDTSIDSFERLTSIFIGNPLDRVQVADMLHEATPMDDMYMGNLRLEQLFFCANGARDEYAKRSYDVGQPLMNIGLGELREYRTSELLEDLKRFFLSLPPECQNLISTTIFVSLSQVAEFLLKRHLSTFNRLNLTRFRLNRRNSQPLKPTFKFPTPLRGRSLDDSVPR